jgi:hypothetical protein
MTKLKQASTAADLEYRELMLNDPANADAHQKQVLGNFKTATDGLDWGSASGQERGGLVATDWSTTFAKQSELAKMKYDFEQEAVVTEAAFIADPTDENAEKLYRESLSRKFTNQDLIDGEVARATAKGEKLQSERIVDLVSKQAFGDLKSRVTSRRAEVKLDVEQKDAESVEEISGWINNDELDGISDRIKELPLTETRKAEEVKKANDYVKAVNGYKENAVTSDITRIKVNELLSDIEEGIITRDAGITAYTKIAKNNIINTSDGKSFINSIFSSAKAAKDTVRQRQASVLSGRRKQLRDAIESQPNVFDPQIATEILRDFANKAVIQLDDKFRDGDFKKADLDAEVNRLMAKFTLSETQQTRAALARELDLADTLTQQQESMTKIIKKLNDEGETDKAKDALDEAISLGIFKPEGVAIKKNKGKKVNLKQGFLDRLKEQFR